MILARGTLRVGGLAVAVLLGVAGCKPVQPPAAQVLLEGGEQRPVGQLVVLDGSKSGDPRGAGLVYRWKLEQRPAGSRAEIAQPQLAVTSLLPDVEGAYGLSLVVSDGTLTSVASAHFTAACGVAAPLITLDPVAEGSEVGLPVQLGGSASDPDTGAPCSLPQTVQLSWRLSEVPAGSQAQLSGGEGQKPWFIPDLPGRYEAEARAVDSTGRAASAHVAITVGVCGTHAPRITELAAAPAAVGQSVQLTAQTSDEDASSSCGRAQELSLQWSFVARPQGSQAQLNGAALKNPSFTPDVPGTYTVQLQVTDPDGHTTTKTVDVEASSCGSNAPVVATPVASPAQPGVGQAVALTASVTDADNDGCALGQSVRLQWSLTAQPAGSRARLSDAQARSPWLTPDLPGSYQLSVVALDSTGRQSAPAQLTLTAGACGSAAPVATIVPPATVVLGQPALVSAEVEDADTLPPCALAQDARYAWSFESLPAGSKARFNAATLATPSFTPDVAGEYVVRLVVLDAEGHRSALARATITAGSCGGQAPTATVAQLPETPAVGQPVLLTAQGSDLDNAPACGQAQALSYRWSLDALPAGSLAQLQLPQGSAAAFTPDVSGDYRVRLVVTDSTGRSGTPVVRTVSVGTCGAAAPVVEASASVSAPAVGQGVQLASRITDADLAPPCSLEQTAQLSWRFDALPAGSTAQLSSTTASAPSFVPDVAGTYALVAVATDSTGRQSAPVTVTVTASACGTNAPVASALAAEPASPSAGQGVQLTAELADADLESTCGLSQTLAYRWSLEQLPAGSQAKLSSTASARPSFTADLPGSYVVALVAVDSTGRQSAAKRITITADACGQHAPTATVAASPASSAVGRAILFAPTVTDLDNGTACQERASAPARQSHSFAWALLSAPAGSRAALSGTSAREPWLTPDVSGSYVVRLVVTDSTGRQSAPVDTTVSASACGTNAPTATALVATPGAPAVGQQVSFSAAVADADNGTSCQTELGGLQQIAYAWRLVQAPAGSSAALDDASRPSPSLVPDRAGSYALELTVTDSTGRSAVGKVSFIVGTCGTSAPAAAPSVATSDLRLGSPVLLRSNASDADTLAPCSAAQTLSYRWSFDALPFGSTATVRTASVKDLSFVPDVAGTYVARVTVTDSTGRSASAPVAVTVGVCGLTAPTPRTQLASPVATPPAQDTVAQVLSCRVQLDARGSSDADVACGLPQTSSELDYRWEQLQAPVGSRSTLSDTRSATPSFTLDAGGTYAFRLYASDGALESTLPATLTIQHAGFSIPQVSPPVACATSLPGQLVLTAGGQGFLQVTQGATISSPTVVADFTGTRAPVPANQIALSGCSAVAPGTLVPAGATVRTCTTLTLSSLPALGPGNYTIQVTNPVQNGCGAQAVFSVGAPPTVTQVQPAVVCAASDPLLPDQATLQLTGSAFAASTQVFLGPTRATSASFPSSTQGSAVVDIPAPGIYPVRVSNGSGCESTLASAVTVLPVPLVFFVDPPVLYNGIQTQATLYVSGLNGGSVTQVRVRLTGTNNALQSLLFTYNPARSGQVQVQVPAGLAAGTYDVFVTDAQSCTSIPVAAMRVTNQQTLALGSIDPPFGYRAGSTAVDLRIQSPVPTGRVGFNGQPRVYLSPTAGGTATALASVTLVNGALANAVVPAGLPAGTYDVIAVNPTGEVGVRPGAFRVTTSAPPLVDAVVPGSIPTASTRLTVRGQNFSSPGVTFDCVSSTGASRGTLTGQVQSSTATTIDVTIPASGLSAGDACVAVVTNPDGSYGEFSAVGLTNSSENMNAFALASALSTARRAPATTSARPTRTARFLYALGGDNGTTGGALSSIEAASLDRFGNLGAWRTLSLQTPGAGDNSSAPRTLAQAITVERFVYLVGGDAGSGPVNLVHRAKVLDPAEAPAITDLFIQLDPAGCITPGLWFYRVAATFAAGDALNPSGEGLPSDPLPLQVPSNLGERVLPTISWSPVPGASGYRIYRTASADQSVGQARLLATVGGATTSFSDRTQGTGSCPAVGTQATKVLGDLGNWKALSNMAVPRAGFGAAAVRDASDPTRAWLYAVSGLTTSVSTDATWEMLPLTLSSDGASQSATTWAQSSTPSLSVGRWQTSLWVADNTVTNRLGGQIWLYLGPGRTTAGNTASVEAVSVGAGGVLFGSGSSWNTVNTVSGPARYGSGFAAAANQLWIFGASNGQPDVTITSGEICGTNCSPAYNTRNWNSNGGNTLRVPRFLAGSAVESARIFQVGGLTPNGSGGTVATNTVESVIW